MMVFASGPFTAAVVEQSSHSVKRFSDLRYRQCGPVRPPRGHVGQIDSDRRVMDGSAFHELIDERQHFVGGSIIKIVDSRR